MATSLNAQVDYHAKATSFQGLTTYGDILVGGAAFEFYNEKNPEDFIQIPWSEVDYVSASVLGKHISRFAIFTKENGHYSFSCRDNKAALRAIRVYVGQNNILRSLGFVDVFKVGLSSLARRIFRK